MEAPPGSPEDTTDDISLLDIVVTLAEGWRWWVLLPLFSGGVAGTVAHWLPKTYQSQSVIDTRLDSSRVAPATLVKMLTAPRALDGAAVGMGWSQTPTVPEQTRQAVLEAVTASLGKQDGLVALTTQGASPEVAQNLNRQLLRSAFDALRPSGDEAQRLQNQLRQEQSQLLTGQQLVKELQTAVSQNSQDRYESAKALGELLQANAQRLSNVQKLELALEGLGEQHMIQPPTRSERHTKPRVVLTAALAALAGLLIAVTGLLLRQGWRQSRDAPETAEKLARIRRGFGFKS